MKSRQLNLRTLDMLRGILAVYVLLGHCRWLLWAGHSAWMAAPHAKWLEPVVFASASLRYGREAVMVFFVLSGFFIHLRFAQSPGNDGGMTAKEFYRRRTHRLGAPYVFALGATLVLDLFGRSMWPALYTGATVDALTHGVFARTGYGWQSVVPAMVGLPSSLGYDFGTNGPLWSLAFEVVYYALYPAWLMLRRSSAITAYGVLPVACLFLVLYPEPNFLTITLLYYPVWLIGAALAELLATHGSRIPMTAAAVAFAAGFALHVSGGVPMVPALPAMIYGAAAVTLCASMRQGSIRFAPVRWFEYLGIRSYSIYIVHFPLVALMSAALFANGGRPMHGWYAVAGSVAAVAFGCACFELCERHFVHHRAAAKLTA